LNFHLDQFEIIAHIPKCTQHVATTMELIYQIFKKEKDNATKKEKNSFPLTIGLDAYLDFGVEVDLAMVPCYLTPNVDLTPKVY
jgi:di/tripeptidase